MTLNSAIKMFCVLAMSVNLVMGFEQDREFVIAKINDQKKTVNGELFHLVAIKGDVRLSIGATDSSKPINIINGKHLVDIELPPSEDELLPGKLEPGVSVFWLKLPPSGSVEAFCGVSTMYEVKSNNPLIISRFLGENGFKPFSIDVAKIPNMQINTLDGLGLAISKAYKLIKLSRANIKRLLPGMVWEADIGITRNTYEILISKGYKLHLFYRVYIANTLDKERSLGITYLSNKETWKQNVYLGVLDPDLINPDQSPKVKLLYPVEGKLAWIELKSKEFKEVKSVSPESIGTEKEEVLLEMRVGAKEDIDASQSLRLTVHARLEALTGQDQELLKERSEYSVKFKLEK
ncbi:MAG: hypothetical protein M5U26_06740 [Planctomycetota bacterium]|nr:hypothetical protein [Planctomycetota bacterium]